MHPSQGSSTAAVMAAVSQAVLIAKSWEGNRPNPVSLPVRILLPGVHPVGGVEVGRLAQPVLRGLGAVGDSQGVAPPVLGLEPRRLRPGVGALAAHEHPHRGRPGARLIPARAVAQQPGQLGDVGLFDPAAGVPAPGAVAGVLGEAFAQLAAARSPAPTRARAPAGSRSSPARSSPTRPSRSADIPVGERACPGAGSSRGWRPHRPQ